MEGRLLAEQAGGWEVVRVPEQDGVELVGYHDRAGHGLDMRILPQPTLTIVLMLDGELHVEHERPVAAGIASGLGVNSVRVHGQDVACVDIHLSPLAAYSILDGQVADLAGTVVGFEDVWGAQAHQLSTAVARTDRWDERFRKLQAALAAKLHTNRSVDPEIAFVWRELMASGGRRRITDLAAETGWSRKRLWSRFTAQIGLTPKRAAMIVRLSPAIQAIVDGEKATEVAANHGYADQSHLTRDLKELSGYTPGELYRDWREGTFVQDAVR
ncbi:helix-turn-helix transcriptional regulator [Kibdelosporangium philippinense]|uniref:Helix-turn-helix transcriptional regulator n=1 Tax=Kibdelosporangium philippinense TaxID=211113 RepID=A0ABS8Z968_9PSEU|nr:helix-turn-helix transcriptional regulator [Kibdelosporangium philippinense]MCE7004425.1 helix-turn-helix transcriptional regulator [Kibdelosporangium philippinense]